MRSTEVDGFWDSSWGIFLDVILELEAETLSESRSCNGRSDHMGADFIEMGGVFGFGRVELFQTFVAEVGMRSAT